MKVRVLIVVRGCILPLRHIVSFLLIPVEWLLGTYGAVTRGSLLADFRLGSAATCKLGFGNGRRGCRTSNLAPEAIHVI